MLYIRMLLIMAVTLYTSRVILRTLGVEDYGIFNVVGGVIAMLSFLMNSLGRSRITLYYIRFGERGSRRVETCIFFRSVHSFRFSDRYRFSR